MATYVMSDLHGCDWAWKRIKNFIQPEDEIICLDNLIAKYESVAEASRQTGYARSNIKSAIERNGTCHGYIWKYL